LDHRFGHHHRYVRDGFEGRFVVRLSRKGPGAPPHHQGWSAQSPPSVSGR
jgi:hypothetical protein